MRRIPVLCALLAAASPAFADVSATAWSQPSSIDMRDGSARRTAPASVRYDTMFVDGDAVAGHVELLDILHFGTFSPATNTLVPASAASASGSVTLAATGAHHLVLRSFDENDAIVGEISADVGIGVDSGFSSETLADMEADKLQRAVNADGRQNRLPHDVAYSTGWFAGAASVALTLDRMPLGGGAVAETKALGSWDADASGAFPFLRPTTRGAYTLRLAALDGSGDPLGTPLEASLDWPWDDLFVIIMR